MQVTYLDDDLRLSRGACQVEQSQDISLGWGSGCTEGWWCYASEHMLMFTHTVHMYTLSLCKRTTSHKTEDARGSCTEDYKKTSMSFLLHFFWGMTLGLNLNFLSKSAVSSLVFFFQVIGATSLYWRRSVLTWLRRIGFNGSQGKGSFGNRKTPPGIWKMIEGRTSHTKLKENCYINWSSNRFIYCACAYSSCTAATAALWLCRKAELSEATIF